PIEGDDLLEQLMIRIARIGVGRIGAFGVFIGMDDEDLVAALAKIGVEGKAHYASLRAIEHVRNGEFKSGLGGAGLGIDPDQALADALGDPELAIGAKLDFMGGAEAF